MLPKVKSETYEKHYALEILILQFCCISHQWELCRGQGRVALSQGWTHLKGMVEFSSATCLLPFSRSTAMTYIIGPSLYSLC